MEKDMVSQWTNNIMYQFVNVNGTVIGKYREEKDFLNFVQHLVYIRGDGKVFTLDKGEMIGTFMKIFK